MLFNEGFKGLKLNVSDVYIVLYSYCRRRFANMVVQQFRQAEMTRWSSFARTLAERITIVRIKLNIFGWYGMVEKNCSYKKYPTWFNTSCMQCAQRHIYSISLFSYLIGVLRDIRKNISLTGRQQAFWLKGFKQGQVKTYDHPQAVEGPSDGAPRECQHELDWRELTEHLYLRLDDELGADRGRGG